MNLLMYILACALSAWGYDLCAVTIVRNEGQFIRGWIEYHRQPSIGVKFFIVYDDQSVDRPDVELSKTPDIVVLSSKAHVHKTRWKQHSMYLEGRDILASMNCSFVMYTDTDEFVVNMGDVPLNVALRSVPSHVASLLLNSGNLTFHHVNPNDNDRRCGVHHPTFLPFGDVRVCRTVMGVTKQISRPRPFVVPDLHLAKIKLKNYTQGNISDYIKDVHFAHFKFPCMDLWLRKAVPGGRLAAKDWKFNPSSVPSDLDGTRSIIWNECGELSTNQTAIGRAVHNKVLQAFTEIVVPRLQQTFVPEICDHRHSSCDPRYFWMCPCKECPVRGNVARLCSKTCC